MQFCQSFTSCLAGCSGRIKKSIISQQSVDQAAYREGFSTEDYLITLTLLLESCAEWNSALFLGLVDFEKAFDTVEHDALFSALVELGVQPEYVDLLKVLYSKQESTVLAGTESRAFKLQRGVKQGDPVSSLLFLAVMEVCFRRLKKRWNCLNNRRTGPYYGMVIDETCDPLTNLRFADDVVLVATSRSDIAKMIADLRKEAAKFGLKLHAGKTKILATDRASRQSPIRCGDCDVQVLQEGEAEKYLGRTLSVDEPRRVEFENRLAMGWAAFFKLKGALCNRLVSLRERLKLFEACVSPCVLYACGTWTMTEDMSRKLRVTRRKMLRWMIKPSRRIDEEWPEYVQRATNLCEDIASNSGCKDWNTVQNTRKHALAAKCFLCNDKRWSKRLLHWKPWFRCVATRNVGHPVKRWTDSL